MVMQPILPSTGALPLLPLAVTSAALGILLLACLLGVAFVLLAGTPDTRRRGAAR